ncbi:MAG: beta-lactamase family protein [Kordiimonadaceae bacterium]|nr:beta-lactamase family protein [Kordiimonadaceae bacterium]
MPKTTTTYTKKFMVLACSILSLSTGISSGVQPLDPSELKAAIDGVFADVNNPSSPGCSVGIQKGQETLFSAGYGMADIDTARPNDADTHFNIASMSKQFTVLSILALQADGKLSVDDDIRKYIPEVIKTDDIVKISHLIHHTSGLMDYVRYLFAAGLPEFEGLKRDLAIEIMTGDFPMVSPAGAVYSYNNGAYVLLAEIVKRVSGQDFETFARGHILSQVDMQSSYFRSENDPSFGRVATPYIKRKEGSTKAGGSVNYSGDGGLVTTINDFLKYTAEIHKGATLWNDKNRRFLTTSGQLTGPTVHPNTGTLKTNYGGAIQLETAHGEEMLVHSGSIDGFNALFQIYPDQGLTLVAFCNFEDANLPSRFTAITDLFFDQKKKLEKTEHEEKHVHNPAPESLIAALSGTFKSDVLKTTYDIESLSDGQMLITLTSPYSGGPVRIELPKGSIQITQKSSDQILSLGYNKIVIPKQSGPLINNFSLRVPSLPDFIFNRVE